MAEDGAEQKLTLGIGWFRFCPFSAVCRAPPGLSQARTFRLFRVSLETSLEGGLCGKGFGLQSFLGEADSAQADVQRFLAKRQVLRIGGPAEGGAQGRE
jgi:hypothetical protein